MSGSSVARASSSASASTRPRPSPAARRCAAPGRASGLRNGESRDGDWMRPAIVAASASVTLRTSLPKKMRAASGHAVDRERPALAEHDVVQVELEDLILGESRLEDERHELFLQLAAQGLLRRQERVLDDLLRERAAADQVRRVAAEFVTSARTAPMGSTPGWS